MTDQHQLHILKVALDRIWKHGELTYPEEGAGLMLGRDADGKRQVQDILPLGNSREDEARHNRYLITARDMLAGEQEAARLGLDVVGIYHSHPDHPNQPSEFDQDWALPWYSYMITSINQGKSAGSRSWRLAEDRQHFDEEAIILLEETEKLK